MGIFFNQIFTEKAMKGFSKYIRDKAIKYGSEIIYGEGENIIAENPRTGEKRVIKKSKRTLLLINDD